MSEPTVIAMSGDFAAVYKPPGMLVHRQARNQTGPFLLQWARDRFGVHVHALHRLDGPTAGLVVFALSPESAAAGAEALRLRRTSKSYVAVVRGHTEPTFEIDYALRPVRDRLARSPAESREAVTRGVTMLSSEVPEPVGRYETARYSLVQLSPVTGRRHQLRRHMKHVFHPILGDRKYGDRDHNRFARSLGWDRLALVSTGIVLEIDGGEIAFECDPDPEFSGLLARLGLSPTA